MLSIFIFFFSPLFTGCRRCGPWSENRKHDWRQHLQRYMNFLSFFMAQLQVKFRQKKSIQNTKHKTKSVIVCLFFFLLPKHTIIRTFPRFFFFFVYILFLCRNKFPRFYPGMNRKIAWQWITKWKIQMQNVFVVILFFPDVCSNRFVYVCRVCLRHVEKLPLLLIIPSALSSIHPERWAPDCIVFQLCQFWIRQEKKIISLIFGYVPFHFCCIKIDDTVFEWRCSECKCIYIFICK